MMLQSIGVGIKIPMTICQNTIQPDMHKKNLAPNGRMRLPSWYGLFYVLGCAIIYLGVWTATPQANAMQWETLAFHSSHPVCGYQCEMAFCRLSLPSLKAPAGPNTAVGQWVWNHPMETESPDTESALVKCTIIPGARPSTSAVSGPFSLSTKRIISRLYLQKNPCCVEPHPISLTGKAGLPTSP